MKEANYSLLFGCKMVVTDGTFICFQELLKVPVFQKSWVNGSGKISSSLLAGTGNDLHCCNGVRGPSDICQPAPQSC